MSIGHAPFASTGHLRERLSAGGIRALSARRPGVGRCGAAPPADLVQPLDRNRRRRIAQTADWRCCRPGSSRSAGGRACRSCRSFRTYRPSRRCRLRRRTAWRRCRCPGASAAHGDAASGSSDRLAWWCPGRWCRPSSGAIRPCRRRRPSWCPSRPSSRPWRSCPRRRHPGSRRCPGTSAVWSRNPVPRGAPRPRRPAPRPAR